MPQLSEVNSLNIISKSGDCNQVAPTKISSILLRILLCQESGLGDCLLAPVFPHELISFGGWESDLINHRWVYSER